MAKTLDLDGIQVEFGYLITSIFYFDHKKTMKWIEKYWHTSFAFVAIYLLLINVGQRWMKSRQPYGLKKPLFVWNLCLAIFSLFGSCKLVTHIYEVWTNYGFKATLCMSFLESTNAENYAIYGYWVAMFYWSKLFELGDTAFIILRKRSLMFLHWYHHVTVLLYTWYSGRTLIAPSRWFVTVNYAVHTCMYAYFALKAAGYRVPKVVAMIITIGQISQMVIGLYVNWQAYTALNEGEECDVSYENIASSLVMYGSYWVLFVHLFYINYLRKDSKKEI